jgi:hypothetical protein
MPECCWKPDDDGVWATDCGQEFVFIDAGPKENHMRFCCYCGKPLKAKASNDMNGREQGDDDGVEYTDPRDEREERLRD